MASAAEVRAGAATTLTYDCAEGRPSAATAAVYTPAGVSLETPTVTIDAVNTTLSASAASGDTALTVASGTGVAVGRYYRLTNSLGQVEHVRVRGISGTAVTIGEDLQYAHASGASFVGLRLSVPVAAITARDENYYVEWSYTAGGTAYVARTYFHVVRLPWPVPFLQRHELKEYLGARASDLYADPDREGEDFAREIAEACDAVRDELIAGGLKPWLFLTPASFKRAAAWRLLYDQARAGNFLPNGFTDIPTYTDHVRAEYRREFDLAKVVARVYDESDGGTVSDLEAAKPMPTVRFSR